MIGLFKKVRAGGRLGEDAGQLEYEAEWEGAIVFKAADD